MSVRVEWFGPHMSIARGGLPIGEFSVDSDNAALVLEGDELAVAEAPPAVLRRALVGVLAQLDALYPPQGV